MKKKHTKYSTILLIGLFGLYTLSSCVNKKQTLSYHNHDNPQWHNKHSATYRLNSDHQQAEVTLVSIKPRTEESSFNDVEHGADQHISKSKNSYSCKKLAIVLGLFSLAGLVVFPVSIGFCLGCCTLGLSVCPTTGTPFMPNNTIVPVTDYNRTFILPGGSFNDTNKSDQCKARMYIPKEKVDTYLSTLQASLNEVKSVEELSTENTSREDIFFQNMTIYELYSKIVQKNFDPNRLKIWFNDHLNPNMQDSQERTLFMLLIQHYKQIKYDDSESLEIISNFLQTGKINLSKKDSYGHTVWDYASKNNFLMNFLRQHQGTYR